MARYFVDSREEALKSFVQRISAICVSEEFIALRKELESSYMRSRVENVTIAAFQDALYSLLVQDEGDQQLLTSRAFQ